MRTVSEDEEPEVQTIFEERRRDQDREKQGAELSACLRKTCRPPELAGRDVGLPLWPLSPTAALSIVLRFGGSVEEGDETTSLAI